MEKPAAWPSSGTGPQPGQEARQHSREGRCQPLVTPSPPCHLCSCFCHSLGVFPNCQLARVLQGKAQIGQQGTRTLKGMPWERGCCSHTQQASPFAGNMETLRCSHSSSNHQHFGVRQLAERKGILCRTAFISRVECGMPMQNKSSQILTENYQGWGASSPPPR